MEHAEKEIENFIIAQGEITVNGVGIHVYDQQVKISNYYIDCIGYDDEGNIYIIEVKKNKIDGNSLSQVLNYMHYTREYRKESKYKDKKIFGVLIGNGVTDYMRFAIKEIPNVFFVNYEKAYLFDEQSYSFTTEYMKENFINDSEAFNLVADCNEIEMEEVDAYQKQINEVDNDG